MRARRSSAAQKRLHRLDPDTIAANWSDRETCDASTPTNYDTALAMLY